MEEKSKKRSIKIGGKIAKTKRLKKTSEKSKSIWPRATAYLRTSTFNIIKAYLNNGELNMEIKSNCPISPTTLLVTSENVFCRVNTILSRNKDRTIINVTVLKQDASKSLESKIGKSMSYIEDSVISKKNGRSCYAKKGLNT